MAFYFVNDGINDTPVSFQEDEAQSAAWLLLYTAVFLDSQSVAGQPRPSVAASTEILQPYSQQAAFDVEPWAYAQLLAAWNVVDDVSEPYDGDILGAVSGVISFGGAVGGEISAIGAVSGAVQFGGAIAGSVVSAVNGGVGGGVTFGGVSQGAVTGAGIWPEYAKRDIFEWVEIDLPLCGNVYGSAPCTAALSARAPRKCWNLRKTCADPANYNETSTLTLRFARDVVFPSDFNGGPFTGFPSLRSVRTQSATVNIAGAASDMAGLGRRGTLEVVVGDFTHDDVGIDPYQTQRVSGAAQFSAVGYNPKDQGTFLARLKARWPYYADKEIRLCRAYLVNGAVTDQETRSFRIKEMNGPSDGELRIVALDVLDLANEKTALCPKPSPGVLNADITAVATSFTVTPAGAGASYATSGRVAIGNEVMTYTRSGDVFTVTRGQRGTTAATHAANDTVQEVWFKSDARVDDVVVDLLANYTATPSSWFDAAQQAIWATEVTRWGSSLKLTTDVVTPTPVATLLAELGDLGVAVWPNEATGKINLRMNRPVDGETVRAVADNGAIEIQQEEREEDRLTQVVFYGRRSDPTKSLTDEANYQIRLFTVDPEAYTLYGGVRSKSIFTRWLDQGDLTTMAVTSKRLLYRFRDTPKRLTVTLDAAERSIALGDVVDITTDQLADADGASLTQRYQVISRDEPKPFSSVRVVMQRFDFSGRYGFIMPNGSPVYGSATDAQKNTGAFISANSEPWFTDGTDAYRII